jgi:2,4-dienoyl-CoA reductase-like NADH-dependent reductase (Old Yellow Enzyme family)
MEEAIRSGKADFISLSRPFIRQPNLVNQMAKDDNVRISCVSCNRCTIEIAVQYNPLKCYLSEAPK